MLSFTVSMEGIARNCSLKKPSRAVFCPRSASALVIS
jgi:hypothetical protein